MDELAVCVIGYGLAGRVFHCPLVSSAPGLRVARIVTGDPQRQSEARAAYPSAEVGTDPWADPLPELVVVGTPNDSHVALAGQAIDRGIPVVVDKPLAPTAAEGQALVDRACAAGVPLTVFQNRRWDTDQLTLRKLLEQGALGTVTRYESRFERWRPQPDPTKWREHAGPDQGGGELIDLGAHLIDQALTLFGPVEQVYAEIDARRGSAGDDDAFLALRHVSGTVSHLFASAFTPAAGPRLRVQGTEAAFVVPRLDPQEDALKEGRRPDRDPDWGMPPAHEHGCLIAGERSVPVPPVPGDWPRFYAELAQAIRAGTPPAVDPADAVAVLRVIEAARRSAAERRTVGLASEA